VVISYVEAAFACILQGDARTGINLIDARYFYFDNSRGGATSHIARMALTDSLRNFCDNSDFLNASWYSRLGRAGGNPSILGFIVKHMLLSAICTFGCPLASTGLENKNQFETSAPITMYPDDFPVLSPPTTCQKVVTQLFVPLSHRCRYIDGILVQWKFEDKFVTIVPMQITIAKSHTPSDASFMENHWSGMVAHLDEWEIDARFLWIKETRDGPAKMTVVPAKETPKTREAGAKLLHPLYNVLTLTVSEVNKGTGEKPRKARASSAAEAKC
jgi:hypothetical protein